MQGRERVRIPLSPPVTRRRLFGVPGSAPLALFTPPACTIGQLLPSQLELPVSDAFQMSVATLDQNLPAVVDYPICLFGYILDIGACHLHIRMAK